MHPLKPLVFLFFSILLSGCQSFPGWFSGESGAVPTILPEKSTGITPVINHNYQLFGGQSLIGQNATLISADNDTLPDLARHFGLGYNDMVMANPDIPVWTPAPGSRIVLPMQFILPDAPRKGIVLNLATMRMFYYPKNASQVWTYPVGVGRDGWNTPLVETRVADKVANPSWHVPPSIHREHLEKGDPLPAVVKSGPDNPLGLYALRLAIPNYLIHGTNKPYGIGMQISHGCIQMYPENIEVLFNKVTPGVPVKIVHQPYLTAWHDHMLYLEAHHPLEKWAGDKARLKKQAIKQLRELGRKNKVKVDWQRVDKILARADGIPTPVLENSPDLSAIIARIEPYAHPETLYGQPEIKAISANDWSIVVASYTNAADAQNLTAMLNHQGPPIPARKVTKDGVHQVIAGPFANKKMALKAARRIQKDFEIKVQPTGPAITASKD